jgi:hypothetical protein
MLDNNVPEQEYRMDFTISFDIKSKDIRDAISKGWKKMSKVLENDDVFAFNPCYRLYTADKTGELTEIK